MRTAWSLRFSHRLPPRPAGALDRSAGRASPRRHRWPALAGLGAPLVALVLVGTAFVPVAGAAQTVPLATATPFAVLAGTAVTDVPNSSITGDVGLSPAAGTNYAGLTQAEVNGTIYSTNGTGPTGNVNNPALLTTAQNDLTTAYTAAAGQSPTTTFSTTDNQLGGQTLVPGVYAFGAAATANLTAASPLILNGEGDTNAVFVFQASSSLVTAANSVVQLENGAQACNVFWQVGSSATLESSSTFVGTIMALTSATLLSGATVQGRVLARNGAVSLDANTITAPTSCTVSSPTTTTTTTSAPTATTTPTGTGAATAGGGGTAAGGGTSSKSGVAAGTGSIVTSSHSSSGESATGSGAAAGSSAASAVVPLGFPHTGFGGAAHSHDDGLIVLGALALASSAGAVAVALRRRRLQAAVATVDSTR